VSQSIPSVSHPDLTSDSAVGGGTRMNVWFRLLMLTFLIVCWADRQALAQAEWQDRLFINVNLGFHPGTLSFDEFATPVIYDERTTVIAAHRVDGGLMLLDLGGGVRIWRSLGVGATYTRFSPADTTSLNAAVPHPLLFNRPRQATATLESSYVESAYQFDAVWMIPITSRVDLALSGGPTLLVVSQDLVSGLAVAENSPSFSTVEIAKVDVVSEKSNVFGIGFGADVTYFIKRMFGVGANVRYVAANMDLTQSNGAPVSVGLGGLRFGVGARIRFR
jgi:hypothetical protein